jgi:prepilin-type N-terminal cleavage/methylation domain-containing protein
MTNEQAPMTKLVLVGRTSFAPPYKRRARSESARRAMTLVELMISLTILTMIAATVATMALAVQTAGNYVRERGTAVQHARVVLDRIDRTLQSATVSEQFPGFLVLSWSDSGGTFPDTLVIWKPSTTAADPSGVPRANELVIIRPDPNNPAQLLEITNPSEPATVTYPASATASWQTLVDTLSSRTNASKVVLTDLLRVAAVGTSAGAKQRGAIRFRASLLPSDADLGRYRDGLASWTSLPWPQNLSGNRYGVRSLACFTELQLVPSPEATSADEALPFFGSAMIWKEVKQ